MLPQYEYNYAGLRLVSALQLPELGRFAASGVAAASVHFTMGMHVDAPPGWSFSAPRHWTLVVPGIATFDIVDGNGICIRPVKNAAEREVRLYLMSSAWSALCYQRGLIPFHAGAVMRGDRAIAFCGPSGAGKSSTVAALVERGHKLVSDDLSVLQDAPGAVALWPSTPRIRLWSEAIDALAWQRSGLERDLFRADKYGRTLDSGVYEGIAPVPLAALYVLNWGDLKQVRLHGSAAVEAVIASAGYRTEFLREPADIAIYWRRMVEVVRNVPVWQLTRPRDWSKMGEALSLVTDECHGG